MHIPSRKTVQAELRFYLLVLCCVCLPWGRAMFAQVAEQWLPVPGLPQSVISAIAQSPDGYIWIATMDGLARYDGVRVTVFNRGNTPGFSSNRLEALYADPANGLWMTTESGRVIRYDGRGFRTLDARDGVPVRNVHALYGDASGNVRIVGDGQIFERRSAGDGQFHAVPQPPGVTYNLLAWVRSGFWAQDGGSVRIVGSTGDLMLALPAGKAKVWGVALSPDGTYWAELEGGARLHSEGTRFVPAGDGSRAMEISYRLSDDSVWSITLEPRLVLGMPVESGGGTTVVKVKQLFRDRDGSVWAATGGSGLLHRRRVFMHGIAAMDSVSGHNVFPLMQAGDGTVWMGVWPTGLVHVVNGHARVFGVRDGIPNGNVTALAQDGTGRMWVGTHGGLVVQQGDRFVAAPVALLPGTVQAIVQTRDGRLWVGTTNGLVAFANGATRVYRSGDGLQANDVRVLLPTNEGDLWIAGYGGITRLHDGVFERWSEANGLPSENIRALHEDADGTMWAATYDNGLARFRDGVWKGIRPRDGLGADGAFQILDDNNGSFWISSNQGVYAVRRKDLNDFADGRVSAVSSVRYGTESGMVNAECNGGLWPAGFRAQDGTLWFPTQNGVVVLNPADAPLLPHPQRVLIESASVNGVPADLAAGVRAPAARSNIEIQYTAPLFASASQLRFRHRMSGLDADWEDVGGRRVATFSHLPPGSYTFEVMAGNVDGQWSSVAALPIKISAPFYMTWWFITAIVAAVVVTALAFAHARVRRAEEAEAMQQAFSMQLITQQEAERKRIAAELHDSIGQRLVVIKTLAAAAAQSGEAADMQQVGQQANHAIEETRSISYNLRPFNLERLGLTRSIESLVQTTATAGGLQADTFVDDVDGVLDDSGQVNLYRIAQESLQNVVKHSAASEISVRVERLDDRLVMTIADNGVGVAVQKKTVASHTGFGLTGMRERAKLMHGALSVQAAPRGGTVVRVVVPIKRQG